MPPSKAPFRAAIDPGVGLVASISAESLQARSFSDVRVVRNQICAVKRFLFTTAVVVGITDEGHNRRYCYEHLNEAKSALAAWDGQGHPPGPWIKCKGAGVELLNPDL